MRDPEYIVATHHCMKSGIVGSQPLVGLSHAPIFHRDIPSQPRSDRESAALYSFHLNKIEMMGKRTMRFMNMKCYYDLLYCCSIHEVIKKVLELLEETRRSTHNNI